MRPETIDSGMRAICRDQDEEKSHCEGNQDEAAGAESVRQSCQLLHRTHLPHTKDLNAKMEVTSEQRGKWSTPHDVENRQERYFSMLRCLRRKVA